jgi:hypothetical protein
MMGNMGWEANGDPPISVEYASQGAFERFLLGRFAPWGASFGSKVYQLYSQQAVSLVFPCPSLGQPCHSLSGGHTCLLVHGTPLSSCTRLLIPPFPPSQAENPQKALDAMVSDIGLTCANIDYASRAANRSTPLYGLSPHRPFSCTGVDRRVRDGRCSPHSVVCPALWSALWNMSFTPLCHLCGGGGGADVVLLVLVALCSLRERVEPGSHRRLRPHGAAIRYGPCSCHYGGV